MVGLVVPVSSVLVLPRVRVPLATVSSLRLGLRLGSGEVLVGAGSLVGVGCLASVAWGGEGRGESDGESDERNGKLHVDDDEEMLELKMLDMLCNAEMLMLGDAMNPQRKQGNKKRREKRREEMELMIVSMSM